MQANVLRESRTTSTKTLSDRSIAERLSRALRQPSKGWVLAGVAVLVLAGTIAVLAIHGRQWRWTGFDGNTSLWSWLQTFTQPLTVAALTVRLLSSARAWRAWRIAGAATGATLAVVVVASYTWQWTWTGFAGKHLWDWLHLLLFPIVVVVLPDWVGRGEPFGLRQSMIAAAVLVGFAALLLGGYRWGWTWTGFTGNSFRDWLDLMIAPFLLPLFFRVVHAYHTSPRAT